jgi:pimeloyl-ACP methyl ester carboxylesterase
VVGGADCHSYPQFDDPTFFEHFNLVAIDLRGHGLSKSGPMEDPFSWSFAADDVAAVMVSMPFYMSCTSARFSIISKN